MSGRHAGQSEDHAAQILSEADRFAVDLLSEYRMTTAEGVVVSPTLIVERDDLGALIRLDVGIKAEFSNEHGTWPGPERTVTISPAPIIHGGPLNSLDVYVWGDDQDDLLAQQSYALPHQGNDEDE